MAIMIVVCISCVKNQSSQIEKPVLINQLIISKKCEDSKIINIVAAGTSFNDNQIHVYDRKQGFLAHGNLSSDTIKFEKCVVVGKNKVFVNEVFINDIKSIIEVEHTGIYLSKFNQFIEISVPDSSILSKAILDNYIGRQTQVHKDNYLVLSLVLMPKGILFSSEWMENYMAFENFAIFNLENRSFEYISNNNNIWMFNPFFEHPIFTLSNDFLFLTYPNTNQLKIYNLTDWSEKSIQIKSNSLQVYDFDVSKLSLNEYRHQYYQSNSFGVKLLFDDKSQYLLRIVKLSQKLQDDEGLNNPPMWAKHLIEFINISSGEVVKSCVFNGEEYNTSFIFLHNELFYVKNNKISNEEFVVFDGFDL
jgi:hypothetical protein